VQQLQDHGIRVMASSIIGLEEHSSENIDQVIDWAVGHEADFHQFMLYTPTPGTPFYAEILERGLLLSESEIEWADIHGQLRFNYHHPHIKEGQETEFLLRAFKRDYDVNGPSIMRMMSTIMKGWKKYRNHPDKRIRERIAREAENLPVFYAGALWAMQRWFENNPSVFTKASSLLESIYREFGLKSRLAAPVAGRIALHLLRNEKRRLLKGYPCEPPFFYESAPQVAIPPPRP
jgi:hypothetical protein